MNCVLCGGAKHAIPGGGGGHALMNCPQFVRVPQPLKDLMREVYNRNPQGTAPGGPLADWIYDNVYARNDGGNPGWVFHFNGDPRGRVEERVYLAVHGAHILAVWGALMPYFRAQAVDVVQAKHCSVAAANMRPDAVVIYLRNKAAVWRMLDEMRRLREEGRLKDTYFRQVTPPGTGRIPDLPGTATARQPEGDGSFGQEITALVGAAFDAYNRPLAVPTVFDFMGVTLAHLKRANVDIFKPWNRPLHVF